MKSISVDGLCCSVEEFPLDVGAAEVMLYDERTADPAIVRRDHPRKIAETLRSLADFLESVDD